ncbi:hypothetical protein ACFX2F_034617 [Malus domestica]
MSSTNAALATWAWVKAMAWISATLLLWMQLDRINTLSLIGNRLLQASEGRGLSSHGGKGGKGIRGKKGITAQGGK